MYDGWTFCGSPDIKMDTNNYCTYIIKGNNWQ